MRFHSILGALGVGFAAFCGLPNTAAQAATFTVNSGNDTDGSCTASSCSLREAVKAANATTGDDVINIDSLSFNGAGPVQTLGEIEIGASGKISIASLQRYTYTGNGSARFFSLVPGADLTIDNMVLSSGATAVGESGGAILNESGRLTLKNCGLEYNSASVAGGAISSTGGSVTLDKCDFNSNIGANLGGALNTVGGTISITGTTFRGNSAVYTGGALRATNSAISLVNSTISTNSITGGGGDGGAALALIGGTLSTDSVTITANVAAALGDGSRGGVLVNSGGVATLKNTLVAANSTSTDSKADFDVDGGSVVDGGFNLIGNNATVSNVFPAGSKVGTPTAPLNPKLAPLRKSYHDVYVHAFLPGSPAIDAGKTSLTLDERDYPRPMDQDSIANAAGSDSNDIGAFEAYDTPQPGFNLVVNRTDDYSDGACSANNCSLRDAVNSANDQAFQNGGGDYRITFDPGVFSNPAQIELRNGPIGSGCNLTITGPTTGVTVTGNQGSNGLFAIVGGHFSITNFGFQNGYTQDGGAFNIGVGSSASIERCSFSNNTASNGGAIRNDGTALLTNCTFNGNQAYGQGGAIANFGTLTVDSCTIVGNRIIDPTLNTGGGIFTSDAQGVTFKLNNSILANNTAATGPNIAGPVTSGDYNLVVNATGTSLPGTHNITGKDPKLGAFTLNGGPTPTLALLAGSPALNAGNTSANLDQRGVSRPQGAADDIGAFELSVETPDSVAVTTVADEDDGSTDPKLGTGTSLREAINFANSKLNKTTISFKLKENRTIALLTALPTIATETVVNGPSNGGVTITRDQNASYFPLVTASNGKVALTNLTLDGGPNANPALDSRGPGIYNIGADLTVTNCLVTNCHYGLYSNGYNSAIKPLNTLRNSTFAANADKGVIMVESDVTLDSCTITGNVTQDVAAGLWVQGSTALNVRIGNTIVVGNSILSNPGERRVDVYFGGGEGSTYIATAPNLLGLGDTPAGYDPRMSNLTAEPLKFGPLAYNGGPTFTIGLRQGSVAIDAGSTSLNTDQRGFKRPVGSADDIGAFEVTPTGGAVIESVALTPTSPMTDDTITATPKLAPPGTANVTYSYVWTRKRGASVFTLPSKTYLLDTTGDIVKSGDIITVAVTADDGFTISAPKTASVTIINSPIQLVSLDLKPRAPFTNEKMVATIRTSDRDKDRATYSYVWKKNGVVVRTVTDSKTSQDFYDLNQAGKGDHGDVIDVTVTASDGPTQVTTGAAATVQNSAPVLSFVTLAPQSPTPTSVVVATYGGRDADGDTLRKTYVWRIGTKVLANEKGSRLDLSKYPTVKAGSIVKVQMYLDDGSLVSKAMTAQVTVVAPATNAPLQAEPVTPEESSAASS